MEERGKRGYKTKRMELGVRMQQTQGQENSSPQLIALKLSRPLGSSVFFVFLDFGFSRRHDVSRNPRQPGDPFILLFFRSETTLSDVGKG